MGDLRFALRQLLKNPGFTIVAVLPLALGIGANTAMFSVVSGVLLRALPYPEPDRLVCLSERGINWSGGAISYPNFSDWRQQQSVFENLGFYLGTSLTLTGRGDPVQLTGSQMSADVFAALGVQPKLGRLPQQEDDNPNAPAVVLLSHSLWQSRFGADPAIVHQTIILDGTVHMVIGVMPNGFEFPSKVDLWLPVASLLANPSFVNRANHQVLALGRLKSDISIEKGRSDLNVIAARLEQQYPETNKTRGVHIDTLIDKKVGNVRRALWILFGAVVVVLLIACSNVANLLLARTMIRERELAVRAALGANRWRIGRQLLTESLLLGMVGSGLGLLLAKGTLSCILSLVHQGLPRASEITLDARVLLFSTASGILTGIGFGLAPAWRAGRAEPQRFLYDSAKGSTTGRAGLRQGLVIAEIALTLVLLLGAGLLLRSFDGLIRLHPGFGVQRILTFRIDLPRRKYLKDDQQIQFFQALQQNIRDMPGVEMASMTSQLPLRVKNWDSSFVIEGQPEPEPEARPHMQVHLVAPGYFRTMGIPLRQGRDFADQDNREHLRGTGHEEEWEAGLNAIIIDDESARRFWPKENPVGHRLRAAGLGDWLTVVGVVGRIKEEHLSEQGGGMQAYLPFLQRPSGNMAVVVKTTLEPEAIANHLRGAVLQIDPAQPLSELHTMKEIRDDNVAPERLNLSLLAAFAGLALLLAAIGLYGVVAYAVSQRTREIGVRVALGATRGNVLGLVLQQGMKLIVAGLVLGLAAALALTRIMSSLLYEVKPSDPTTYVGVSVLLLVVGFLACWLPARRATKIDPIQSLRHE